MMQPHGMLRLSYHVQLLQKMTWVVIVSDSFRAASAPGIMQ